MTIISAKMSNYSGNISLDYNILRLYLWMIFIDLKRSEEAVPCFILFYFQKVMHNIYHSVNYNVLSQRMP